MPNIVPFTSAALAEVETTTTDFVERPGRTRIHKVLRANAAANAVAAAASLRLDQRVDQLAWRASQLETAALVVVKAFLPGTLANGKGSLADGRQSLARMALFFLVEAPRLRWRTPERVNDALEELGEDSMQGVAGTGAVESVLLQAIQAEQWISPQDMARIMPPGFTSFTTPMPANWSEHQVDAELRSRGQFAARLLGLLTSSSGTSTPVDGPVTGPVGATPTDPAVPPAQPAQEPTLAEQEQRVKALLWRLERIETIVSTGVDTLWVALAPRAGIHEPLLARLLGAARFFLSTAALTFGRSVADINEDLHQSGFGSLVDELLTSGLGEPADIQRLTLGDAQVFSRPLDPALDAAGVDIEMSRRGHIAVGLLTALTVAKWWPRSIEPSPTPRTTPPVKTRKQP